MSLTQNVELVRRRIQQACERAGRPTSSVTLIAVTKGVPIETIQEAVALGLTELGENRVQEAQQKQDALGSGLWARGSCPEPAAPSPQPIRWHLIGHLQRNKVKQAVRRFDVIHSVDSLELIDALDQAQGSRFEVGGQAARQSLPIFIQVNVSAETTKFGCAPEAVTSLARSVRNCPHVKFAGLMTMAPWSQDPEAARPHFRRLRELRDALAAASNLQPSTLNLSMGMSQDFDVAIEEGADFVRIGTAIFGPRD